MKPLSEASQKVMDKLTAHTARRRGRVWKILYSRRAFVRTERTGKLFTADSSVSESAPSCACSLDAMGRRYMREPRDQIEEALDQKRARGAA